MKNESEVREWVLSVDEQNTRQDEIQSSIESAWPIVFGRELSNEDADVQVSAWSHLCAAVI